MKKAFLYLLCLVLGLSFLSSCGEPQVYYCTYANSLFAIEGAFQYVDALRLNTIQIMICTVLSALVMVFTETPTWTGISACTFELFHVGVLSMGLGYFLQIIGQRHLDSTPATLLMSFESVFAAIFTVMIIGRTMTSWQVLGCGLIFTGIILSQIPIGNKKVHSA